MPRFNPDPTKATAGMLILPKDSYTFELGEPKAFIFDKNPEKVSYGIQYPLIVASEGQFKGRTVMHRLFLHSDAAAGMAKQFQMIAAGYAPLKPGSESAWNDENGGKDWSFDTDDKSVGSGWHELKGKIVSADVDIVEREGNQNQTFKFRVYEP